MYNDIDLALLQFFNGSDSVLIDQLILTLTHGLTWVPLYVALFVMVLKNNESAMQIFIVAACCILGVGLTAGIDDLVVKPLVGRLRPTLDPQVSPLIDVACGHTESGFSFFSAHSANTFTVATYMMLLVRHHIFSVAITLWALLNCYTRLYLGVHYPSDVLCGIVFGLIMGALAYLVHLHFYKKHAPRFHYISSAYTRTGYAIGDIDMVVAVLTFTIIYALIWAVIIA